jgi:hypothetical protein
MSTQSSYTYTPESTTEVNPKSKRKKIVDSKGNVISDTAKNK